MDDTVPLSTTRQGMEHKLKLLHEYCNDYKMHVNNRKTKYFTLNCSLEDKTSFVVGDMVVEWCEKYVYLGSVFTCDGSVSAAIAEHAQGKTAHVLKFVSFRRKNRDVPFYVNKRVFSAAVMSAVLYGYESWLDGDIKSIEKLYNWYVKQLLGVHLSTCNDVCFAELGLPPLRSLVMARQRKFFQSLWCERQHMINDPWVHVVKLVLASNTCTSRHIDSLIHDNVDDVLESKETIKQSILHSMSSRQVTYRSLNPDFIIDEVYCKKSNLEIYRIA